MAKATTKRKPAAKKSPLQKATEKISPTGHGKTFAGQAEGRIPRPVPSPFSELMQQIERDALRSMLVETIKGNQELRRKLEGDNGAKQDIDREQYEQLKARNGEVKDESAPLVGKSQAKEPGTMLDDKLNDIDRILHGMYLPVIRIMTKINKIAGEPVLVEDEFAKSYLQRFEGNGTSDKASDVRSRLNNIIISVEQLDIYLANISKVASELI